MREVTMDDIQLYVYRHVDIDKFDQVGIISALDRAMPDQVRDDLDLEITLAEKLDAGLLARHQWLD
ncbi:hypothetical protein FDI09_gp07 [Mycobacterium phage Twister]|uniref:Uncharacterized protein n=2 Tax=Fromanvirus twister TaxID=1993863 RepID=H9NCL2_9CAUD|nr:hypothetical protein FDI09_gp07 [Mycobacterium phage Twister]AFF28333.1 hypothetical protein TWISTER_88 [Mycobacterium phage Twister]QGJ94760.1 hypothetical protein SEA_WALTERMCMICKEY_87 [Mycobacterium phage WalterMcMickey]